LIALGIDYKKIIEGAIMASDQPLSIEQISKIFTEHEALSHAEIRNYLEKIAQEYKGRSVELKEVATGYRFQVSQDIAPWIQKLWQVRPTKYSHALLETLAIIAYKQPITRAEIEDIRGIVANTNIMKTLLERGWIKVIGHKDMPGKPALYTTTKQFLNDINLKSLADLPPLSKLEEREQERWNVQLELSKAHSAAFSSNQKEEEKTGAFNLTIETNNE
jgi:segregation and condensation protein B